MARSSFELFLFVIFTIGVIAAFSSAIADFVIAKQNTAIPSGWIVANGVGYFIMGFVALLLLLYIWKYGLSSLCEKRDAYERRIAAKGTHRWFAPRNEDDVAVE